MGRHLTRGLASSLFAGTFLWALAGPAFGQTDPATLATECIAELDRAQQAVEAEDRGMAMVLVDMSGDTCRAARDGLLRAIEEAPESEGATVALATLWQMELRRVRLLSTTDQCAPAREALQAVSAQARLPASVELDYARMAHAAMACGPRSGAPAGGSLEVSPGMADAYYSGTTLGEQDAALLSADCWGSIPASPTYRVQVTDDMQVSFTATGGGDLVMALSGPSGTYCNDDYEGLNPAVSQYLTAGTYDLYIGEYSSSGYAQEFSLTVSANALYASPAYTYPTYGDVYVGPGYARTTLSGDVWGYNDASVTFDPSCAGYVAENPDFRMYVEGASETWVTVTGTTGADLTLVVRGPSGTRCADDSHGSNPQLHETLAVGAYDVWVGDKAGPSTGASYGVQFSAYDPMLVLATAPAHGEASVGPGSAPVTLTGSVTGAIPAGDFFGSTCYGSVGTAPSHRLTVTADTMVEVVTRADDYMDLIIALSGPAGTFCNDDFEGLNPGVRRWLTTGDYLVYVGQLSPGGTTPFTTTITATTGTPPPDPSTLTTGRFGNMSVGYGLGTATFSGTSGGERAATDVDASCRGYITEEPSFVMDVSDYLYTTLRVMSEGDTTLVMMGPDGVVCNDDYAGVNPGLDQYLSPGRYGLWIGSYAAGISHPFMISVSGDGY